MSIFQCLTALVAEPNRLGNRLFLANVTMPFAGLAHIAKLLGKLQQANLGANDLLFLGHHRCPSQDAEAGRSATLTAPRPASALASAL